MIKSANIDVVEALRAFSGVGLSPTFLVPTQTGMEKSIMDATVPVRTFLKEHGIHDYDQQPKGPEAKVVVQTILFSSGQVIETTTSLYRPETKDGDPRIWIRGLKALASPTDLVAILVSHGRLICLNCSKGELHKFLSGEDPAFWAAHGRISKELPGTAAELLGLLREIAARGFITTQRTGDTGVGYTLETLLGIKANNSKDPDYKGIELKSGRASTGSAKRATIFSQVPDWGISRLKGSRQLLEERGRLDTATGLRRLFHTMSGLKPNSFGLQLELDASTSSLHQIFVRDDARQRDVTWLMEKLSARLAEKHGETFWIKARTRGRGSDEQFHYVEATYTTGTDPAMLATLIEAGAISLDYTIKELPSGTAKDQGYLFKIGQKDLPLLFRAPVPLSLV